MKAFALVALMVFTASLANAEFGRPGINPPKKGAPNAGRVGIPRKPITGRPSPGEITPGEITFGEIAPGGMNAGVPTVPRGEIVAGDFPVGFGRFEELQFLISDVVTKAQVKQERVQEY